MTYETDSIHTLTIDRYFHGVVAIGKQMKTTNKNVREAWWSKWKIASCYEIERDMANLNVVFRANAPLLSGIVTAFFTTDKDIYEIAVPRQPLSFGVRLVLVHDNSSVYFKLDPECYTDLPHNFVAWISGILSQFHDETIGDVHTTHNQEWIDTVKMETISEVRVWDIFSNAYTVAVQNNSHRQAYDIAVTNSKKEIHRMKKALALEEFKSQLQSALNNIPAFLKVLKSVGVEWGYGMSCVDDMKRMHDTMDDFGKDRSVFESELTLAKTALEYQSLYDELLEKTANSISVLRHDADVQEDYVGALAYALELLKKNHQTSDLYVVFYALSFIERSSHVQITYDVINVRNTSLKNALIKYNQDKLQPTNAESIRIAKAKSFSKETSVLSWRLNDFDELLENHREMGTDKPLADNLLDRIEAQFKYEKWGLFYRKEIGLEPLMRNGTKLEDYIANFNKILTTSERTLSVEKILKTQILQEFGRLSYWELKKETLSEVNDTIQILCALVTRLGSVPSLVEPVWPNLPLMFNSSTTVFRNSQDVENFVISYQNFKKPTSREWPLSVSDLERSNFNATIDNFVGKELKQAWNKSVVKVYDDARKRVEEAEDKYEKTIKEIVRLAEDDNSDLLSVYLETIKKCHTTDRNTSNYDTWWELVELEFCRRSPRVFGHVANISNNKETFMQQVVENKWRVAILPNEREHERWIEELSFALLRRAHDDTAKQLLVFVEKCVAKAIEERRDAWWWGMERIDRTVDEYYDVEFVSASEKTDAVLVPCAQFQQLKPELSRILVYATRIYGLDAIGMELFNWIADERGKWMVTDHIKEQFVSAHGFVNSDDPIECFYGALTALLFDFLNVYEVCCTQLIQDVKQQGINLYRALVRSFPVYGRIVSKICGWSSAYGNETQSAVDVFERLSLSSDYEIPERTSMTTIQNIAVTKHMIKTLDKKIDIKFLEQCLSGEMWLPSGPLYTHWKTWKNKWFYNAEKVVFDYNKKDNKLIHIINKQQIHGFDDLTLNNEELKSFLERHSVSRNVIVKFSKPADSHADVTESTLPPSIINAGMLDDLLDVIERPEEDDYIFDEELFDNTAFASFSFYTAPYFPSLEQELIEVGVDPTELQLLDEDEISRSEISDLVLDIKDLRLEEVTSSEEEEEEEEELNREEYEDEKYQTRRFVVKSKDFKRHLASLYEFFQLVSLNDND